MWFDAPCEQGPTLAGCEPLNGFNLLQPMEFLLIAEEVHQIGRGRAVNRVRESTRLFFALGFSVHIMPNQAASSEEAELSRRPLGLADLLNVSA